MYLYVILSSISWLKSWKTTSDFLKRKYNPGSPCPHPNSNTYYKQYYTFKFVKS